MNCLHSPVGVGPAFYNTIHVRMHADRPYFDPSGPPVWTASFSPLYEICGSFYSQKISCPVTKNAKTEVKQTSQSMLYIKRAVWLGEVCSMGVKLPRAVGSKPRRSSKTSNAKPLAFSGISFEMKYGLENNDL